MELRQLEHFVALADEKNFTRAASRCHIGQPALSGSIQALERELGVVLFRRTTRRVELTSAAQVLLPAALRTLAAAAEALRLVEEQRDLRDGQLRVGSIEDAPWLQLSSLIEEFSEHQPGVVIHHTRGPSPDLIEAVRRDQLDVAVARLPPVPPPELDATVLLTRPYVLLCRSDHHLAGREKLPLAELVGEAIIGSPSGTVPNRALAEAHAAQGAVFKARLLTDSVAATVELVTAGLGIALLPTHYLPHNPVLTTIAIDDPMLMWTAAVLAPPQPSPATAAFVELCTKRLAEQPT